MREILFRGKTDKGQWIEGMIAFFFDKPQNSMIMPSCYFGTKDLGDEDEKGNPKMSDEVALGGFIPVIPESVGQFTGLPDKNGKKIFEGDILSDYVEEENEILQSWQAVHFDTQLGQWMLDSSYKQDRTCSYALFNELKDFDYEVIGNIHDNPELIGKEVSNG